MSIFGELIESTNLELIKSMDVLNSMMELEYLSQILEFQDEVDREDMSLWGMQPEQKNDGTIMMEQVKEEKTMLQLDNDCLSCSLEKYRPTIKQAFKMACVQYQPKPVCFKDKKYQRKSLINLKKQLVEDLCTKDIFLSKSYREYC